MLPIFYGQIEKGRLTLNDKITFQKYLHTLNGEVQLVLGKKKKIRSTPQNDYYWGVIIKMICDETGAEDKQAIHDGFRSEYLKDISKGYPIVRSTTDLSTIEFKEYCRNVQKWAADFLGLYIPDPNEDVFVLNINDLNDAN